MAGRFMIRQLLSGKGAARRVALELAHEHGRAAQRSEGSRTYEAPTRRRLHHPHGMSGSGRQAHQLERLVCGDAATYAEQDSGHSLTFSPAPQLASATVRAGTEVPATSCTDGLLAKEKLLSWQVYDDRDAASVKEWNDALDLAERS